jgi:hypothetical protein
MPGLGFPAAAQAASTGRRAAYITLKEHLITAGETVTVPARRLTICNQAGEDAVLTSPCPGHGRRTSWPAKKPLARPLNKRRADTTTA